MKLAVRLVFLVALLFITGLCSVFAQSVFITVKDMHKSPLTGATVELMRISDTTSVFTITDLKGVAEFKGIFNGVYVVRISFIGFSSLEKTISVKADSRSFEYRLDENSITLEEVTIAARKPLITQEDDKMIIDPEPLAQTSTNTLEVLESTPGLFVDQDGGIFLNGATPAAIYINGREQKMSNQDITALLRSLPPGSVQRIEVIRTPSTKYDAASSGGIVNVILKKGVKLGRFGSLSAGMNQGVLGNRFAGFSINSSGDRSNYYLNANYNHHARREELNSVRLLDTGNELSQRALLNRHSDVAYMAYGINFDATDNISLHYDGRLNLGSRNSNSNNNNVFNENDVLVSESVNLSDNVGFNTGISQDFGLLVKFDTIGSELDTKLSYNFNSGKANIDYSNSVLLPVEMNLNSMADNQQQRHFIMLQSDISLKLKFKFTLESGIKGGFQQFESTGSYYFSQDGLQVYYLDRSSNYQYIESINAAYTQLSKTLGKHFVIKSGVRMEHTLMKGDQTVPADTSFMINRVDWFPYVYLSRKVFEMKGFELRAFIIYRKTIYRPDYQKLNPYVNYMDEFMYEAGNPALKPQFSDNFEANVSFNDMPVFAIGRTYTRDIFSEVVYRHPEYPAVAVRTYDNLGKSTETYLRGIAGIPPGGKYFFAIGAQYNLNEYNGVYQGEPLQFSRGSWRLFTFHSLTLFKETKITLSGFMMLNGQYNFYELEPFGQLNIGLTQTFFDKKLTISLNARDVLHTMVTRFELNQTGVYSFGDRYTDNQRFGIQLRYNFGLSPKKERNDIFRMNGEDAMQ